MPKAKKRHKSASLPARHLKRARPAAPRQPRAEVLGARFSLGAPSATADQGSGTIALPILLGLLIAAPLMLIATALVPLAILPPSPFSEFLAQHRDELATVGVTAELCILGAFLIAHLA